MVREKDLLGLSSQQLSMEMLIPGLSWTHRTTARVLPSRDGPSHISLSSLPPEAQFQRDNDLSRWVSFRNSKRSAWCRLLGLFREKVYSSTSPATGSIYSFGLLA